MPTYEVVAARLWRSTPDRIDAVRVAKGALLTDVTADELHHYPEAFLLREDVPDPEPVPKLNPDLIAMRERVADGTATANEAELIDDLQVFFAAAAAGQLTPGQLEDTAVLLEDWGMPFYVE